MQGWYPSQSQMAVTHTRPEAAPSSLICLSQQLESSVLAQMCPLPTSLGSGRPWPRLHLVKTLMVLACQEKPELHRSTVRKHGHCPLSHKLRKGPVSEREPTAMQRDKEAKPKGPGQHQDTEPKARSWQVGQWKGSPEDEGTTWQE